MAQTALPYFFMRGGTSRGLYFRRADLPQDRPTLSRVLARALGAGHPLNIDGLGGGAAVTTKVAMLSSSDDSWADVDYFFAQVAVEREEVDFKPTCGNILAGVGPAAIEMGLVTPRSDVTEVKIRCVNTGARVRATVQTPGGLVCYEGDTALGGVPGTAAPVELLFLDVVGSLTGALLPTGRLRDCFGGVAVTCLDVAMPLVIARASDLGVTGYESAQDLDDNIVFFEKIETIRQAAGRAMGLGDVSGSVVPKFAVIAPAQQGGHLAARYFMPWKTHPSMAVTGGQCLAACALSAGTVSDGLLTRPPSSPALVILEHPSGCLEVLVDFETEGGFRLKTAGVVRTARKLADGALYIPQSVWTGDEELEIIS